jgi:hypothetical protein
MIGGFPTSKQLSACRGAIPVWPQTTIWTGDPVWIADLLAAQGVKLVEYPGWRNRGHGNFKDIRGVMVHHTGSRRDRHGPPAR